MVDSNKILFCWGVSHATAPIEFRERINPNSEQIDAIYAFGKSSSSINELAVISTCNRLEVYGTGNADSIESLLLEIATIQEIEPEAIKEKSFIHTKHDALYHLFEITAGLDSQIVGEVEITGQVKMAFADAQTRGSTGPILNQSFQKAFQSTKWIRTNTKIGIGQINIATVAVDLARKIFGHFKKSKVLVVGGGDIAEKTIIALKSRGAENLIISNRTFSKAHKLANTVGGNPYPFGSLDCHLFQADVIICSTGSREPIITQERVKASLKKRAIRPLCILDLALPRDVEASIADMNNVFLYNLDDLAEMADQNLAARKSETQVCLDFITEKSEQVFEKIYSSPNANQVR